MEWRVGSCWGGNPPWLLTTPRYLSPPIGALADRDEIIKNTPKKRRKLATNPRKHNKHNRDISVLRRDFLYCGDKFCTAELISVRWR